MFVLSVFNVTLHFGEANFGHPADLICGFDYFQLGKSIMIERYIIAKDEWDIVWLYEVTKSGDLVRSESEVPNAELVAANETILFIHLTNASEADVGDYWCFVNSIAPDYTKLRSGTLELTSE